MHRKRPEHKTPLTEDSLLAQSMALKHLIALGLPPQSGMFPSGMESENTKSITIKKPNRKAQTAIIHQIYKTPGM